MDEFLTFLGNNGWPATWLAIAAFLGRQFIIWAQSSCEQIVDAHLSLVDTLKQTNAIIATQVADLHRKIIEGNLYQDGEDRKS